MILLAHAMAQISINTYSLVALACVIKSHTAKLAQKPSYLHLGIKAVGDSHVRESNFLDKTEKNSGMYFRGLRYAKQSSYNVYCGIPLNPHAF
mmetsp:Transcript_42058/g.68308  ORF Transcript_42058/g.68308 Transcript_42058/m.68308 type:complete len:93 (-) Transcript_42058:803-1081(-)